MRSNRRKKNRLKKDPTIGKISRVPLPFLLISPHVFFRGRCVRDLVLSVKTVENLAGVQRE